MTKQPKLPVRRLGIAFTASALVALAACVPEVAEDGRAQNPSEGSPGPDAGSPTSVTVTVYDRGTAAAEVAVHYHDAQGRYLGSVTTDERGRATIEGLPEGGAVTAPVAPDTRPVSGEGFVTTITGVVPGDELVIGDVPGGQELDTPRFSLPGWEVGDSNFYTVFTGCRQDASPYPDLDAWPSIRDHCLSPDGENRPAVAYASYFGEESEDGYAFRDRAYSLIEEGRKPYGGGYFFDWQTEFAEHTVKLVNPPAHSNGGQAGLVTYREGIPLRIHEDWESVRDTDSWTFRYGDRFFDEVLFDEIGAEARVSYGDSSATTVVRTDEVATVDAPVTTSLDLSVDLLGPVSDLDIELDPIGVTWTPPVWGCRDNPGPPDAAVITFRGDARARNYQWTVLAPGDGDAALTLPELPADVESDIWPKDQFLSDLRAMVAFTSDSELDWDAIRTGGGSFAVRAGQPSTDAEVDKHRSLPAQAGTRCTVVTDLKITDRVAP